MATKKDLLKRAEEVQRQADEADGSYAEYLHAKAHNLRELAVDAPEEE